VLYEFLGPGDFIEKQTEAATRYLSDFFNNGEDQRQGKVLTSRGYRAPLQ
jgi:hypothetical protein